MVSGTVYSDSVSYALTSTDAQRSSDFGLPGRFTRFDAIVGLDPEANVEVEFAVKVDGVTQKDQIVQPDAGELVTSDAPAERHREAHSERLVMASSVKRHLVSVLTPCSRNRRNWMTPDVTPATGSR